jgi:butyrate kinase
MACILEMVTRSGGLIAYLGTNDCRKIEEKIALGNEKYKLVYDAFILQVAKAVGAGAAVLSGKVNAIVLTGNVLKGTYFRNQLKRRIRFMAPIFVFTRNSEMEALAHAVLDMVENKQKPNEY